MGRPKKEKYKNPEEIKSEALKLIEEDEKIVFIYDLYTALGIPCGSFYSLFPKESEDYKTFFPTNVLVTGYDIITFWVSRMITMGMYCMNEKPFDHVMIHGLVRDSQGRKMSKSLGNGIDPLEIIDKCGADALRFALLTGNSPGNDMRFSDEKIESARNFTNKIWNAARFALMNIPDDLTDTALPSADKLGTEDKWILTRLSELTGEVCENLDKYELGIALGKLYDFFWGTFCDWYVELIKPRLFDKEGASHTDACRVLSFVLRTLTELLHPFMPFITETIWQQLPHEGESIVITSYPKAENIPTFTADADSMELIISAVKAVRARRAEMNVPPSRKAKMIIVSSEKNVFNSSASPFFEKLAQASGVEYADDFHDDTAIAIVSDRAKIFIPLAEMVDIDAEIARLSAEEKKFESEIARIDAKLSNEGFVAKAPAAVVEAERTKRAGYEEKLASVRASIKKYQN